MSKTHSTGAYCPSCHDTIGTGLGDHWRTADACSTPAVSPQQHAVAQGLLFTSGRLIQEEDTTRLRFETPNESLANWIASTFGVLTARLEQVDGRWEWQSHPTQGFHDLAQNWVTSEGEPTVPETVDISPETLRTVYAIAGGLRTPNGNPRPVFSVSGCTASAEAFEELTRHFYPMQFETLAGDVEVYLNQTPDFFQYIDSAVPGCEAAWPEGDTAPSASRETCPHCLHDYAYLATHWDTSSACTPPMLSWRQHALVEGVLLGGGRLESAKTGYRLVVEHPSRRLLEALDDTFGALGAGVQDASCGGIWKTRASTEFGRFLNWLDEDGSVHVPPDLHHTSEMLRVAYALSGAFEEGQPRVSFRPAIESDAFAEEFFEEFDPMSTPRGVVLRDVSEFFGYIGWIPLPGCAESWPNSS